MNTGAMCHYASTSQSIDCGYISGTVPGWEEYCSILIWHFSFGLDLNIEIGPGDCS